MTLSELLVQYRLSHDLSQRQFAVRCGVSNGYISMLERNINPSTGDPVAPSLPTLKKIASGMGVTLDTLFSMVDDMPVSLDDSAPHLTPAEERMVESYRRAPQAVRDIVDVALAPYSPIVSKDEAM